MKFTYEGKRIGTDEPVTGTAEAADKFALSHDLRREGIVVAAVREERTSVFARLGAQVERRTSRVSLADKIFFAGNLSAMLAAGLPLARSLSILARQGRSPLVRELFEDLATAITKGSTLSEALAKHAEAFPRVFVAMVAAGEQTGKLAEALALLADQMGKTYALRRKIRSALMYPSIIVLAMGGIGVFITLFVIPGLSATFSELGVALPWTTRVVLGASTLLLSYGALILAALVVGGLVLVRLGRTGVGRPVKDRLFVHAPVLGGLVREMNTALTARTLSSLVAAGVDLPSALTTTSDVVQNTLYQAALARARETVTRGSPLASVFSAETRLFPVLVGEMIEVGEETGKLAEMLGKIAVYYEDRVDAATKDFSTVIEPVLMVVIGGGVGFFAVALIQPIYSITDSL